MPMKNKYDPTSELERILSNFDCRSSTTGKIIERHMKHITKLFLFEVHSLESPRGELNTNDDRMAPMAIPITDNDSVKALW